MLLCLPLATYAQVDIGAGGEFGFPMLYNKDVGSYNHSTGSPGARVHFTYLPPNGTFVPTLSLQVMPYTLPVTKLGNTDRVLNMKFTTINAMVYGRVRKQVANNREWYYGLGIGATYMQGTKMDFNKANLNNLQVLTDSSEYIKAVIPNIAINAEYRIPISAEMPLAVGIGGQVLYSYYSERQTTTRMDVVDENYNHYKLNPKLSGHMLNPSFYVIIYYRFAGRERY
jgi:hypothetical protein